MARTSGKKSGEEDAGQRKLDFSAVYASAPLQPEALSVGEVTALLEEAFEEHPVLGGTLTVRGEMSNLKRSARGHLYFTLKDEEAAIGGIIWASTASRLRFDLEDGQEVFLTGRLEIYRPQGTYSIVASKVEPVGIGPLQLAFLQIKARLEAEGLFMEEFKKAIPEFPQRIGIVTSGTGAVIHDMLRVIRRKNPMVDVLIAPVKVQGEGASDEIAQAISELNHPHYALDVIIVGRGGGSLEDLFCFSEETVVRAIFNSTVPIITGIGHEPDFSLADAVADYSASTPTAAAEWAVPDMQLILEGHAHRAQALLEGMRDILLEGEQTLDYCATRMLDYFGQLLASHENRHHQRQERFIARFESAYRNHEERLSRHAASLEAFNPLQTLARGYAIPTRNGRLLRSVQAIQAGDTFRLRMSDGTLECAVQSVETQGDS